MCVCVCVCACVCACACVCVCVFVWYFILVTFSKKNKVKSGGFAEKIKREISNVNTLWKMFGFYIDITKQSQRDLLLQNPLIFMAQKELNLPTSDISTRFKRSLFNLKNISGEKCICHFPKW